MPDTALLPCPWCNGKADWDSKPGATGEQFWCLCLTDDCTFYNAEPFTKHARKTDAIAAWNRRAAIILDPNNAAQVDAVALILWDLDKANWASPDYSQHENVMRERAKMVIEKLRDAKP